MKIYCLLFDTFPRHPEMENLFKTKNLHYGDYLCQTCTVTTLVSMFSGKTPSEMRSTGIGHSHTYALLSKEEQKEWDKKIIFNMLPDDWKIHLHAMPRTRGDDNSIPTCWPMYSNPNTTPGLRDCKLLPDDICGRDRDFIFYDYQEGDDEKNFIKKMQDLPADENHFIVLKYNHYHDMERGKHDDVFALFKNIINQIDFEEENSLFWLFADHGEPEGINEFHSPPDSWLSWVSVTDNITNQKITKNKISSLDFKNTILNRIFNKNLPNDVLSDLDMDRIYVTEDSRGKINEYHCTTASAVKCLDDKKYKQYTIHNAGAPHKNYDNIKEISRIYDGGKYGTSGYMGITNREAEIVNTHEDLKSHLKNGIWKWYFNND
jgi:hypothetical protein